MRAIAVFGILVLSLLGVESAQAQDTPAFFKADGQDIVNPAGEPVVLKGVGLGGWLMPEGYAPHSGPRRRLTALDPIANR